MLFIKLANEIIELKKKDDDVISRAVDQDWEQFCDTVMVKINKDLRTDLGGVNPREKKQCASDNDKEIDIAKIF